MNYMPKRLSGREHLLGATSELHEATVLDFWQWAFSNLRMNNIRGVFAEWMVAKLLDIPQPVRESWGEWDLLTQGGVKIEVKTSAYVQSWQQKKLSRIGFTRLKTRKLDSNTNIYSDSETYNADIYVFCVQFETDFSQWNALDIKQWRFYVISRKEILSLGFKSLSLRAIEKRYASMSAAEFSPYTTKMIQEIMAQANEDESQLTNMQ